MYICCVCDLFTFFFHKIISAIYKKQKKKKQCGLFIVIADILLFYCVFLFLPTMVKMPVCLIFIYFVLFLFIFIVFYGIYFYKYFMVYFISICSVFNWNFYFRFYLRFLRNLVLISTSVMVILASTLLVFFWFQLLIYSRNLSQIYHH